MKMARNLSSFDEDSKDKALDEGMGSGQAYYKHKLDSMKVAEQRCAKSSNSGQASEKEKDPVYLSKLIDIFFLKCLPSHLDLQIFVKLALPLSRVYWIE